MKKEELKQQLKNRKGYYNNGRLKKGVKWLSKHYNVTIDLIKEVYEELKREDLCIPDALLQEVKSNNKKFAKFSITNGSFDISNNTITKPGTYWITGCVHAPFHNKSMYKSTFNYFLSEQIELNGVILAGDIIDANSLSFHDKGNVALPGVNLDWEYRESNKFLDEIDNILEWCSPDGNIQKYYLYGNHEDRYNRLIKTSDASKYGKALKSPEEGLKLNDRGYHVFTDWKNDVIHIGKHLDVNHGEFLNVYSAKKTIDTYRKSTIYFHTHRFQIFMEGMNAGFNMGFGGDINAPVFGFASRAMKNSWVNSSCLVTLDNKGMFHVQPLLFINNKLIVNGKEY